MCIYFKIETLLYFIVIRLHPYQVTLIYEKNLFIYLEVPAILAQAALLVIVVVVFAVVTVMYS